MSLLAIALCFALFLYWWVVGYAVVRALHATRSTLQDALLAPPVGAVVTTLCVFLLNRAGLPVWRFGLGLGIVLPLLSLLTLWKLRSRRNDESPGAPPRAFWRRAWPFAAVLLLAFVTAARPMWTFGFDWLSFCNDDMANYCLAADRFYVEGYFDFPKSDHLLQGTFWADDFWFMHVMAAQRPGCELLLSWVMSMTGLNAHEAFMPAVVAMHLGLICTVGAMALQPWDWRRRAGTRELLVPPRDADENYPAALTAAAMAAVSSMVTLGLLYQLIAQVLGLALLAVMVSMVLRPFAGLSMKALLRHGLLVAVAGAGLLVIYPEACPFLGVSFFAYVGIAVVRRRLSVKGMSVVVLVGAVAAVVLIRSQAYHAVTFMLMQSGAASTDAANSGPASTLFPYFMIPKGLSDLWGITRVGGWGVMPILLDASIVCGAIAVAFAFFATGWLSWRGRAYAAVSLVMLVLGVTMFRARAGFGLFKLAMYVQPFVIPTVATAWFLVGQWVAVRLSGLIARWRDLPVPDFGAKSTRRAALVLQLVPLVALAAVGMRSQAAYVLSSYGIGTSFLAVSDPSRTHITREFRQIAESHPNDVIVSDSFNLVVGKFQALYTPNRRLVFPSNLFFRQIINYDIRTGFGRHLPPETLERVAKLQAERWDIAPRMYFRTYDPANPKEENNFFQHERGFGIPRGKGGPADAADPLLVMTTGRQGVLNRRYFPETSAGNFVPMRQADASDLLVFVASEFGQPYFVTEATTREPALYQLEEEPEGTPFFAGTTMCAVGRYMLFQAINPSDAVRLSVSITASYQSDGENALPPALAAIGDERKAFPVKGRGSARLFSPPLKPQFIGGRPYLMYDMGTDGQRFPAPRTGLMKWFGTDVAIDRRVLVGYVRDISLVSEDAYGKMKPPGRLDDFTTRPTNSLRNPQVEYSGFYEDGWVSEDAYVRLSAADGATDVVIRGQVPVLNDASRKSRCVVSVDDVVVSDTVLGTGEFTIRARAAAADGWADYPRLSEPKSPAATTPPGGPLGLTSPFGAKDGARTIRVQFIGPIQRLGAPDNRPASAQLKTIGFEKPTK